MYTVIIFDVPRYPKLVSEQQGQSMVPNSCGHNT